jgi:hypothetical protein
MGSGGCRSTNASLLFFSVSTAATATVFGAWHLHRPTLAGLAGPASDLPENDGRADWLTGASTRALIPHQL